MGKELLLRLSGMSKRLIVEFPEENLLWLKRRRRRLADARGMDRLESAIFCQPTVSLYRIPVYRRIFMLC